MYKIGILYHLLLSSFLFFIGEFSTLLVFQLIFIIMFLKPKETLLYLYLPMLFFILIKLFASSFYLLYFIALGASLCFILHNKLLYSLKKLLLYSSYLLLFHSIFSNFEYFFYELYIELEISDSIYFISDRVVGILMIEHLFILFILGYNREKLFRNNICT